MNLKNKIIKIIHEPSENEPYIVVSKPRGLPSAPLHKDEDSALTQALKIFPNVKEIYGKKEVEKGLVHRIDTETEGLVLIAQTQSFYDKIIEIQNNDGFIKSYISLCEKNKEAADLLGGFPQTNDIFNIKSDTYERSLAEKGTTYEQSLAIESYFRPFGSKNSSVRPVTECSGRAALKKASGEKGNLRKYFTRVNVAPYKDNVSYLCISEITRGFRHQVRCHLAWIGFPVIGDELYNPCYNSGETMKFTAYKISFINPITKIKMEYSIEPDFLSNER